ncbi:ABC-type transport auxiliary lipoprotein family protein [Acidovorax sp. ACV01]|uniref:ABC-type transport auxiliary lipoprotein family protein n=1 Tax=Acidovorax sp. ACV01 TaxID=2769311 RepID=UPI0017848838|nr:ABC-type transport auxiliary lipoprotein family protein [Acidovorax sp. ACV01]MBD9392432.1 membrane integrity-associated transporter subunit PqiC [Acidovorax sp. ACV01]
MTNTIKNIAANAYQSSAGGLFASIFSVVVLGIAGCSALPSPPSRPALYDFGPGALAPVPTDRRAPLPPLALADVEAPGLPEGSNAVLYRLAYSDTQQLRPYSQARWSQPPAQLLQQRLREHLGQRRAVLKADDAAAQARDTAQGNRLPSVLRVELEEFSHIFVQPTESAGVVRLRATVVDLTLSGEVLRGQRVFIARTPARSADAAGGVAALAEASTQVAQELAAWVEQVGDVRQ